MDLPVDAAATGRAAEPVVRPEARRRPGRLIELDVVDLPAVRRASPAEQESQRDRPADLESFTRPDVDVAGLAAGMRRTGGVALDDRRATKWSGGKTAVSKLLVGRVDSDLVIAAGTANLDLEAGVGDLAERREGQRVEHAGS